MRALWGQTVSQRADGQPRVEAGSVARNASAASCDVSFFGADMLERGRVVALFKIVKSMGNLGGFMNIGVVDASVAAKAGDCGRAIAWALNAYKGKLLTLSNPVETLLGSWGKQLGPALEDSAEDATVEVAVDMDARRMLVSVNGAAAVDAGVTLPAKVRLWCSIRYAGDAVQLVSVSGGGGVSAAAGSSAAAGGGRQQGATAGSQAGYNGSGAGGGASVVQAGAGGVDEQAAVGSKRKRAQVYQSILSPAAKAARTGSPGGAAAGGGSRERPAENAAEVREHVNVKFRWEWRAGDGTYEAFDKDQCIKIETCYRRKMVSAIVWGKQFPAGPGENLKCFIDFEDHTAAIAASEWVTTVRRWCPNTPMGESWDHQVENVTIVNVERGWRDYTVVETALFDRLRADGRVPTVSRGTHELVKVQRIQNRRQLRLWQAEEADMQEKRGSKAVELSSVYAWHGSGKTPPTRIATGDGLMMQVAFPSTIERVSFLHLAAHTPSFTLGV